MQSVKLESHSEAIAVSFPVFGSVGKHEFFSA